MSLLLRFFSEKRILIYWIWIHMERNLDRILYISAAFIKKYKIIIYIRILKHRI